MKKIFNILAVLALLAVSFASCDVTREPKITPKQAPFESMTDVQLNRDALYALLRGAESIDNINIPDFLSDLFHLTLFDNNTVQGFYQWDENQMFNSQISNDYYSTYYTVLMQSAYFMWRTQEFMDRAAEKNLSDEDLAKLKIQRAEVKVMRALAHWRLIQRFSKPWDGVTDGEAENGIIMVLNYDPLALAKAKKSSRAEIYAQIKKDLSEAIAEIPADANKEATPAIYLTQDYAYAIMARVCLTSKDWQGAADAAKKVMDNYPIKDVQALSPAEKKKYLEGIWVTEDSPEIVVRLYATPSIGAQTTSLYGGAWMTTRDGKLEYRNTPLFMLEKWVVGLFQAEDVRSQVYISRYGFYLPDIPQLAFTGMFKFSGNQALRTDKTRQTSAFGVHLFNSAEAYLIYAEAKLAQGDLAEALAALTAMRAGRGLVTEAVDYTTPDEIHLLMEQERVRELFGEGHRLNDLQRWGRHMERKEPQDEAKTIADAFGEDDAVHFDPNRPGRVEPSDKRWVWEFPLRDIETNESINAHRNWK